MMRGNVLGALSRFHRITSDVPADAWASHYRRYLLDAEVAPGPGIAPDPDVERLHLMVFAFMVGIPLPEIPAVLQAYQAGTSGAGENVERVIE